MKQRIALTIFISIIQAFAVACNFWLGTTPNPQSRELNVSTTSPQGTYTVRLKGQKGPPEGESGALEDPNHKVQADITKAGKPVVTNFTLYSGDGYDTGFGALYPDHRWLSDTTIEFGNKDDFNKSQDELYIANQTNKQIPYLFVKAGKYRLFLLFDIKPHSTNKFLVYLEPWERYIGCAGKFDNDTRIPYQSGNFSPKDKIITKTHYCVSLKATEIIIESPEFDGNRLDGTTIPKGTCPP